MPGESIQYPEPQEQSEHQHQCQCKNTPTIIEGMITGIVSREVAAAFKNALEQAGKYADEVYSKAFDMFKKEVVAHEVGQAVADAKNAANAESIREIEHKFNMHNLIQTVSVLPSAMTATRNQIMEKRQTMRTVRQSLSDADLTVKEEEAALLADIIAEINPGTGKPMFSNDKARQAELMVRKKADPNYLSALSIYNAAKQQADFLEDDIYTLESKLKGAEAEFQGVCKVLGAVTAEMNIYAQICGFNETHLAPSVGFSESKESKDTENEKGAW